MNREELLQLISDSVKNELITIKDIVDYLVPKKQKKTADKKAYYKAWYEKNKFEIIERVKLNKLMKSQAV